MTDTGRLTGSREPDPSSIGSGPAGFDPGRFEELAERCETATAQYQRRLLSEAYRAVFGGPECIIIDRWPGYQSPRWDAFHKMLEADAFLDAAMSLVPEGHDMQINLYWGRDGEGSASVSPLKQLNLPRVFAATPAFALCAAALRARAALIPPSEPTEK